MALPGPGILNAKTASEAGSDVGAGVGMAVFAVATLAFILILVLFVFAVIAVLALIVGVALIHFLASFHIIRVSINTSRLYAIIFS